jgi:hypothetical protein
VKIFKYWNEKFLIILQEDDDKNFKRFKEIMSRVKIFEMFFLYFKKFNMVNITDNKKFVQLLQDI